VPLTRSLAAALLVASPALASDDTDDSGEAKRPDILDGAWCSTSSQCGPLKCVNERCRDVGELLHGVEHPDWSVSTGHSAMFGNGRGYGLPIAITDISATVTEPFLMAATVATDSAVLGALCFVPVGLSGPIVHLVNGRPIPAIISFFAWTSLAATTFVVGGLFGLAFSSGAFSTFNSPVAWTAGLIFGAAGAASLTWLDVWMARDIKQRTPSSVHLTPTILPTHRGALASLAISF
jgi:hypothetical protein